MHLPEGTAIAPEGAEVAGNEEAEAYVIGLLKGRLCVHRGGGTATTTVKSRNREVFLIARGFALEL